MSDISPRYRARDGDICENCGEVYEVHFGSSRNRSCPGFRLRVEPSDEPPRPLEGLDIRELLLGDVTRLAHVHRFSSVLVLKRETTAEHTFFSSWFVLVLCMWLNKQVNKGKSDTIISVSKALMKVITHDLEECRTGDINRLFKHSSPDLRQAINDQAKVEALRALEPIFGVGSDITRIIWEEWLSSKDSSPEGLIVALADYMSVLSFMWSEIRSSNRTMLRYHAEMLEYVKGFSSPVFDFLRPVVDEVQRITFALFSQRVREEFEI